MEWPVYPKDPEIRKKILVGNPDSNVGIVTLWTNPEDVAKQASKKNYAAIGSLVTTTTGISAIIRNVLYHGGITDIVVTGENGTSTKEVLETLVSNGIDTSHKIIGHEKGRIEKEIPAEAIDLFRRNVKLHFIEDYRTLSDKQLAQFQKEKRYSEAGKLIFPDHEVVAPNTFPSELTAMVVRRKKVIEAWPEILFLVRRFGVRKKSQHGETQELPLLITAITNQNPDLESLEWHPRYGGTKKDFIEKYLPKILTGQEPSTFGLHYTYGKCFWNFDAIRPEVLERLNKLERQLRDAGFQQASELAQITSELKARYLGINQIDFIADLLKQNKNMRNGVAITWNPALQRDDKDPPCISLLNCLIQEDRLYQAVYIRSNDMVKAWPENAMSMRIVQSELAKRIGIGLGDLVTISMSAHIYQDDYDTADEIAKETAKHYEFLKYDARGNIVIAPGEDTINLTLGSPDGEEISVGKFSSFAQAQRWLDMGVVSTIQHALYAGYELGKAESARRLQKKSFPIEYEQDHPLKINAS